MLNTDTHLRDLHTETPKGGYLGIKGEARREKSIDIDHRHNSVVQLGTLSSPVEVRKPEAVAGTSFSQERQRPVGDKPAGKSTDSCQLQDRTESEACAQQGASGKWQVESCDL